MNNETASLHSQLDLNRDEFARIAATPGVSDEIKGLCQRSQKVITQLSPVIRQRDEAEEKVRLLSEELESMRLEKTMIEEDRDAARKRLESRKKTIPCSQCGAEMPDDTYARAFGRCARHADEEKR